MEPKSFAPDFAGLTRRDFLKFLPIAGSALLLNGCVPRVPTAALPSTWATEPTTTSGQTRTSTISPTLEPSGTFTLIPEPPPVYLPMVDKSHTTYPLPLAASLNDMPLNQALQERHSSREFRTDELTVPLISSLLWAGFGVNRVGGKRTAPSAYNVQDIAIYLATGKGLFRYDAASHSLAALLSEDLRPFTGTQGFVATAPLNLVYVSDYDKIGASGEECLQWSWAHTGCIVQNIYLACTALGLATVVRSTIDRQSLGLRMELNGSQHITLAQTLGYPI